MLPVHGQDRDMPRLEGEDVESYRTRLSMKGSSPSGAARRRASSTPWPRSDMRRARLSPSPTQDPERWAEFIVFLKAPSKAASTISPSSTRRFGRSRRAAQSPPTARRPGTASRSAPRSSRASRDTPVAERLFAESGPVWLASATFWRATSRRAAPRLRRGRVPEGGNNRGLGKILSAVRLCHVRGPRSCIEAGSEADSGAKIYPMCSPALRCSGTTYMTEGGEADAENTHSGRH